MTYLTAGEMAEADRISIEEFGISVLTLMENAGWAVARLARKMLGRTVGGKKVCVMVGRGNNGGDGLVAARCLHNWGADVLVVLGGERGELRDVPAGQLAIVDKIGVRVAGSEERFSDSALLIDALLGYGAKGDPREPAAGLIRRANSSGIPILAVDVPSGLDATSGAVGDPCIQARATVTFVLPKTGFLNPAARKPTGKLYLADISMPGLVYRKYSQEKSIFAKDTLVRIW
jgi:NAD(P)H-hydrate epimerase